MEYGNLGAIQQSALGERQDHALDPSTYSGQADAGNLRLD
jgi:hypothetical protein